MLNSRSRARLIEWSRTPSTDRSIGLDDLIKLIMAHDNAAFIREHDLPKRNFYHTPASSIGFAKSVTSDINVRMTD